MSEEKARMATERLISYQRRRTYYEILVDHEKERKGRDKNEQRKQKTNRN